jgi:hypothetical protein
MFAEIKDQTVVTFPYDYNTLLKHNPYTKFSDGDLLTLYQGTEADQAGKKLVRVTIEPEPSYNVGISKLVQNNLPILVGDAWTLGWSIVPLSQEELAEKTNQRARQVRRERNQKLAESDWTQLADSVINKTVWAVYRQALRDLPSQTGFPWAVEWPLAPGE